MKSAQEQHAGALTLFRYGLFVSFYVLCVRVVFVVLYNAPQVTAVFLGIVLVALAVASWYRIKVTLYGFAMAVPLVSGLQILGLMRPVPLLTFGFAIIYLSWLSKKWIRDRNMLASLTLIDHLVDILSAVVLVSLVSVSLRYPIDVLLYRFWLVPVLGQDTFLYSIDAAQIIFQGLMFYRMLTLEVDDKGWFQRVIPVISAQAIIIVSFSFFQVIQGLYRGDGLARIHLPFNDIHSYGSFLALLLFGVLAIKNRRGSSAGLLRNVSVFCVPVLIALSQSRAAWAATLIVLVIYSCYRFSWRACAILVCVLVAGVLSINLFYDRLGPSEEGLRSRLGRFVMVKNYLEDPTVQGRLARWQGALGIIKEYPLTGSGIGTFYGVSPGYMDAEDVEKLRKTRKGRKIQENAHNYYLQLGADLGIVGLSIFLCIIYCVYKAGIQTVRRKGESWYFVQGLVFGLSAYLLTMVTGHPLILPNQQFLFWFIMASITVAYSLSVNERLSSAFPKYRGVLYSGLALALIGGHIYGICSTSGRESNEESYGLYAYEGKKGEEFRYTMGHARVRTVAESDLIGLELLALPYNVGNDGLELKVFLNDEFVDQVHFTASGAKPLYYYMPSIKGKFVDVKISVNKTFNPYSMGLNEDNRDLGVILRRISFPKTGPKEGVGFYQWEEFGGNGTQRWPDDVPSRFRWTGMRASMNIQSRPQNSFIIYLMCAHPEIQRKPVHVKIWRDLDLLREEVFTDTGWRRVEVKQGELNGSGMLTFQVSRTWNPRLEGVSEDPRDLGVAVATQQDWADYSGIFDPGSEN